MSYRGRFAPTPSGPLHAGSLVAALASFLDARAHQGRWLLRIEDVDIPRCVPGTDAVILAQLAQCGLEHDGDVIYQSRRGTLYQAALDQLIAQGGAYPCACSRQDIARANAALGRTRARHGELVYPGTCRPENGGLRGRPARAWRLRVPEGHAAIVRWTDRRLGPQHQRLDLEVGDFVLHRADGLWSYQIAVVVDDADQGITHVVRGEDLADNTARQIFLQQRLGLPTLHYLHTPLVLGANGEKLSKQNGAQAVDLSDPLRALAEAGRMLCIDEKVENISAWLARAVENWRCRWPTD